MKKIVISKELFIRIMSNIKKQSEKDERLYNALSDYTDCSVVVAESLYLESLLDVLKETIDNYEYISRWLYEDVEKIVRFNDGRTKVKLDTAEQLYDFLINN